MLQGHLHPRARGEAPKSVQVPGWEDRARCGAIRPLCARVWGLVRPFSQFSCRRWNISTPRRVVPPRWVVPSHAWDGPSAGSSHRARGSTQRDRVVPVARRVKPAGRDNPAGAGSCKILNNPPHSGMFRPRRDKPHPGRLSQPQAQRSSAGTAKLHSVISDKSVTTMSHSAPLGDSSRGR